MILLLNYVDIWFNNYEIKQYVAFPYHKYIAIDCILSISLPENIF